MTELSKIQQAAAIYFRGAFGDVAGVLSYVLPATTMVAAATTVLLLLTGALR